MRLADRAKSGLPDNFWCVCRRASGKSAPVPALGRYPPAFAMELELSMNRPRTTFSEPSPDNRTNLFCSLRAGAGYSSRPFSSHMGSAEAVTPEEICGTPVLTCIARWGFAMMYSCLKPSTAQEQDIAVVPCRFYDLGRVKATLK